jgi:thiosulfate/3-mercaptopyruvate sulfurtransferase
MSDRSPLIDAGELHTLIGRDAVRIADVRWYLNRPQAGRAAYDAGHLPGAIFVDLDSDLADEHGYGAPGRHPLPTPQEFARRLGQLGVGSEDFVVAYDDMGGTIAARLWWMLDNLGHRGGVAILDGGIQAWQAAGYELSTDTRRLSPATLELGADWQGVIQRDDLAARLDDLVLIDGRARERYRGEVEPIDPVAGHIPGAVNAPVGENVDALGRLRAAQDLRSIYAPLTDDSRPTVVSCGSGTTACHNALALRLAGMPDPILYVGSFSDWSRSGMPVETGEPRVAANSGG